MREDSLADEIYSDNETSYNPAFVDPHSPETIRTYLEDVSSNERGQQGRGISICTGRHKRQVGGARGMSGGLTKTSFSPQSYSSQEIAGFVYYDRLFQSCYVHRRERVFTPPP